MPSIAACNKKFMPVYIALYIGNKENRRSGTSPEFLACHLAVSDAVFVCGEWTCGGLVAVFSEMQFSRKLGGKH